MHLYISFDFVYATTCPINKLYALLILYNVYSTIHS